MTSVKILYTSVRLSAFTGWAFWVLEPNSEGLFCVLPPKAEPPKGLALLVEVLPNSDMTAGVQEKKWETEEQWRIAGC